MKICALRMNSASSVLRRVWASHGAFLVLILLLGAAGARADTFNIVFTGSISASGSFTTDGSCSSCSMGAGLLSFTVDIGQDTGVKAFDLDDPGAMFLTFDRPTAVLIGDLLNSETADALTLRSILTGTPNFFFGTIQVPDRFSGTFTINAATVPEPSPVILLVTVVAMAGYLTRRKLLAGGLSRGTPDPSAQT